MPAATSAAAGTACYRASLTLGAPHAANPLRGAAPFARLRVGVGEVQEVVFIKVHAMEFVQKLGNELVFSSLAHPQVVDEFVLHMNELLLTDQRDIILNFKNVATVFPNVCVPISGMMETLTSIGFRFEFYYQSSYLLNTCFKKPCLVSEQQVIDANNCLDKIWKYNNDDVFTIYSAFLTAINQSIVCEEGVVDAFIWCIYETLENVLRHSGKDFGYVMGQVHKNNKYFTFCIYDTGRGIFNSLLPSEHKPQSPADALRLAVSEGVTRDQTIGKGNGLFGLHRIIEENGGQLNITSNTAKYKQNNRNISIEENVPQLSFMNGCTIDFQLKTDKSISLSNALRFKGSLHPLVNEQREAREDDVTGHITFKIKDIALNAGTRYAAEKVRIAVMNDFKTTKSIIELDFSGIPMISSSFADELVGKLMMELGFVTFNSYIKLVGLTSNIQIVIERAVVHRMADLFNGRL